MRAIFISLAVLSSSLAAHADCRSMGQSLVNLNYKIMAHDDNLHQMEVQLGNMMNRMRSDEEVEMLTFSIEGLMDKRKTDLDKWNELRLVYEKECPPPTSGDPLTGR